MLESIAKKKPRLLIFIVAYNAEKTIRNVLTRVPADRLADYETEVLIIDDASRDATFEKGLAAGEEGILPFKVTTLFNPVNQGYGGNQKIGYQYAIREGFDIVALVHGDGQYAPEMLPVLAKPLAEGRADAVFGSRMMTWFGALKGGMPMYKYVGNRILTFCQNWLLRARLSEFHSGYRLYSTAALKRVPFHLNSNDFHFDTEIIIELLFAGQRIHEIPIPTYYGDEISHVNGLKYAKDVIKASLQARMQDFGLFYSRKFDLRGEKGTDGLPIHTQAESIVSMATEAIPAGAKVLEIGRAEVSTARDLAAKGCRVTVLGEREAADVQVYEKVIAWDLDHGALPVDFADFDYVLMLDVFGFTRSAEIFVDRLRDVAARAPKTTFVFSSGNVGYFILRFMHLIGQFNYSKRGIVKLTNARLFTIRNFKRLLHEGSFDVIETRGCPAPYLLAFGGGPLGRSLYAVNRWLLKLSLGLFAYEVLFVAKARPSLDWLLERAQVSSAKRVETYRGQSETVVSPPNG